MVEDSRLAQSQQSELVRREKEATQAVKKLEADLFAERADHSRQVVLSTPLKPLICPSKFSNFQKILGNLLEREVLTGVR